MKVSRSGYYAYLKRLEKPKITSNLCRIAEKVFLESRSTYGTRRMSARLKQLGFKVGRFKARTLMKQANLTVRKRKTYRCTTDSTHRLKLAPNLLNRDFNPPKPNMSWGGDITYIRTKGGWLFLSILMDYYSRQIVGYSMGTQMDSELVSKALKMAVGIRRPKPGLIHHTDRGSQYADGDYKKLLKDNGMRQSMSRKGDCWDNAPVERFFGSLKREWLCNEFPDTRLCAYETILQYIHYYNSERLHSYLGYKAPMEHERLAA